ncbi:MAG: hypothetical protein O3B73_12400 [bacterium]|nr:hypothetical protein [bacterium]
MRLFLALVCALLLNALPAEAATARQEHVRETLRNFFARYNRVEGFFAGYQLKIAPAKWQGFSLLAQTGYGIQNEGFRWETGMAWANKDSGIQFTVFDRTASHDDEIIRNSENSLFAILYKGDYKDYFRAKNGFEFRALHKLKQHFKVRADLSAFTYSSMGVTTQWSTFRPNSLFRANPTVTPGKIGVLELGAQYDTRRNAPRFLNAWRLSATFERGFREFAYNGFSADIVRHQKTIWGNQAFILSAKIATRTHTAEQFLYDLGGVGTLRGYNIKEFTGNRILMANVDYMFRGDIFSRVPIPAAHLFNLILFADSGWARTAARSSHMLSGFRHATPSDFKTDVGIAIGITERLFRLNFARRLDRTHDNLVVSARFFREF